MINSINKTFFPFFFFFFLFISSLPLLHSRIMISIVCSFALTRAHDKDTHTCVCVCAKEITRSQLTIFFLIYTLYIKHIIHCISIFPQCDYRGPRSKSKLNSYCGPHAHIHTYNIIQFE